MKVKVPREYDCPHCTYNIFEIDTESVVNNKYWDYEVKAECKQCGKNLKLTFELIHIKLQESD